MNKKGLSELTTSMITIGCVLAFIAIFAILDMHYDFLGTEDAKYKNSMINNATSDCIEKGGSLEDYYYDNRTIYYNCKFYSSIIVGDNK